MNDTIAAVATAAGVASLAIVRLSGPRACDIARSIAPEATLRPRHAQLCDLLDRQGVLIDRGIVLYFQAPRSFTGEDVVEFQTHGGYVVAQEVLEALIAQGARPARPGEFSKRAFLNGKIDLSEAEAIARIIEAKSVDAARMLARQIKGELGRFVEEIRGELLGAMAHTEVMIDYAEEEIPSDLMEGLTQTLERLRSRLEHLVESSRRRRGLIEGFRVAIVGKPNVGKSSLLNALLQYERAIVSDIAGTTRDTIEEHLRIGSHIIRLIDTAGIRNTGDTIEKIGVERSLKSIEEADLLIAIFDLSRPWEEEDERILEELRRVREEGREVIVLLNKRDLPRAMDPEPLASFDPLVLSTRESVEPLIEELSRRLDTLAGDGELMLASARQIEAVERAGEQIVQASEPLRRGELELFSYHLQEAIGALSELTHPFEHEEMLERMFGEFCLGK